MNKYDFQDQVYRNVTHNLFNVAVSQFNKQDKYLNIKKDIIQNLSDEYYTRAICKCKYKDNWKGISAKFALKNKWVFLIYIYNKLIKR